MNALDRRIFGGRYAALRPFAAAAAVLLVAVPIIAVADSGSSPTTQPPVGQPQAGTASVTTPDALADGPSTHLGELALPGIRAVAVG